MKCLHKLSGLPTPGGCCHAKESAQKKHCLESVAVYRARLAIQLPHRREPLMLSHRLCRCALGDSRLVESKAAKCVAPEGSCPASSSPEGGARRDRGRGVDVGSEGEGSGAFLDRFAMGLLGGK